MAYVYSSAFEVAKVADVVLVRTLSVVDLCYNLPYSLLCAVEFGPIPSVRPVDDAGVG